MFWLNNQKIFFKISLVVVLLALVAIGAIAFSSLEMTRSSAAYSDLVNRIDVASTVNVRAGRAAERYLSKAYQIAASTSATTNAKLAAELAYSRTQTEIRLEEIRKKLPEKSAAIQDLIAKFSNSFAVCQPGIHFAMSVKGTDDVLKASARLQAECNPVLDVALAASTKLVEELMLYSADESARLQQQSESTIRKIIVAVGSGLLLSIFLAMFIAVKSLSQPIARLKAVMEKFAGNDMAHQVPGADRRDEIGDMARAVEVFKTNGLEVERLKTEQVAIERHGEDRRKADMKKLADDFEGAVGKIIHTFPPLRQNWSPPRIR